MSNYNEVYKAIMKKNGLTQAKLAEKMGYAGQATVAKILHDGITIGNIRDMAERLGYTIVIEKRSASGRQLERYELERKE